MDNSAYITLSRQLALFRDMEVTANNVANANTSGFNSEHIIFNSYLTRDINQGVPNPMSLAYNPSTYRNTDQGVLTSTGNELDIAIQGEGYFTVTTPLGNRYTRAGNFQLDGEGRIVTPEGYPLLDNAGQPIFIPEDANKIEIGEAGNVKVNGDEFVTVGVVAFANPRLLERLDGKLFKSEVNPSPAVDVRVAQGMLENSNVRPVNELTRMMKISRSVESTSKFIEVIYDLQRKTSNTWAQQS